MGDDVLDELIEAASLFLDADRRAVHDPTGWWGMEEHIEARDRLERAIEAADKAGS